MGGGERALAAEHEGADDETRRRAVRHALAGVARRNVDVSVAVIASDEGRAIHRLHHHPGPAALDVSQPREVLTRPRLKPGETLLHVGRFAGLVIFPARDEPIVALVRSGRDRACPNRARPGPSRTARGPRWHRCGKAPAWCGPRPCR